MKKIVQISCIALVTLLVGCKPSADPSAEKIDNSVDMSNKSIDMNQLYQFYYSNPQTIDEKEENEIIDYVIDKNLNPTRSVTGIYYEITQEGTGDRIRPGDELQVHYTGKFLNDTVFDSSVQRGKPLRFKLGTTGLILGWIEGLRYMKEGSKMLLVVPSRMAYKDQGFGSMIEPNTPLSFELEVLKVN